jgi:hypothetical protein
MSPATRQGCRGIALRKNIAGKTVTEAVAFGTDR